MSGYKICPFCAEEIKPEAIICKHCGVNLKTGQARPKERRGLTVEDGVKTGCGMFIVLPLLILFGIIILAALARGCSS